MAALDRFHCTFNVLYNTELCVCVCVLGGAKHSTYLPASLG